MGYERDMNGIPSGNLLHKEFANCLFTRGYRLEEHPTDHDEASHWSFPDQVDHSTTGSE
jgi:hypothetical protein